MMSFKKYIVLDFVVDQGQIQHFHFGFCVGTIFYSTDQYIHGQYITQYARGTGRSCRWLYNPNQPGINVVTIFVIFY